MSLYDVIGLAGTAMVVLAYVMLQTQKLSATSFAFNFINLLGALLLLVSLLVNFNLASLIIEIFWIAASALGLYRSCKERR